MNQIRQWNGNANLRLYQSQLFIQWTVRDYLCPLYLMILSPTNDFFPFGNPDRHLQNQAGKRSNSYNFANLGMTKKPDVIKIISHSFYFWLLFSSTFAACWLLKITMHQSLRLASETLEYCCVFHPQQRTRSCRRQMKYTCTVNWDLIFWLRETELWKICSCRCLFHLDEVSRVELNNGGKYQPSFNWLQPEWNYRHICIQHSRWNDKLFGLTTVNCEFHWHFLHNSPQPWECSKATVIIPAVFFFHVCKVQISLLTHVYSFILFDVF